MKYLVILADGMADYPIPELNHQTPLEYANTPHTDYLAAHSVIGMVLTIPGHLSPGSDVANLSVLGYDPDRYYSGRSPLEAVSMGVELSPDDLALRCNLVTLSEADQYQDRVMIDYSAGEISTEESRQLMNTIRDDLSTDEFVFYSGISYRNLMVWKNGAVHGEISLTPPHDISGQKIAPYLPQGVASSILLELEQKSLYLLQDHPINQMRRRKNHHTANSLWFWGQGVRPSLPSFKERFHLSGAVVAAVDLVRGLGICAGLSQIEVPGATGSIETNFWGKAQAALRQLKTGSDFVFLHIESPDEAGHQGNLSKKIWSIEQIDQYIIGSVIKELDDFEELRVLLLPDHPTPLAIKTHTKDPVPFLIYDKKRPYFEGPKVYNEKAAGQGLYIAPGHELMGRFINGDY